MKGMIEGMAHERDADWKRAAAPLLALGLVAADLLGLYFYLGRRLFILNPVWIYLSLYAVAFGLYVYAAGRLVPKVPPALSRAAVPAILLLGLLFRLAVLPAPPGLSTDMNRYVWDGRLIDHGINPYHWAPYAQSLRFLRDPLWNDLEYKSFQTIYMPVSQALFAGENALFHNNLIGYKLVYVLFDLGVMGLILLLLRGLELPPTRIIWYAWCPIPITEVALAGHQDIVGVFFLLLAFILARRSETARWAAIALVAAALTKGFALLLLPLFCRTYGKRFTLLAVGALLYLGMPLWVYLPEFLHGMNQYLNTVNVNSGLFHALNQLLAQITRYHETIAQKVSDAAILGIVFWSARWPAASFPDLLRRAFIVLAGTLLLVPTLFPWYLLWALPFLPMMSRPSVSLILLSGLVALVYTFYISIVSYWWLPFVEYGPFYLALAWEFQLWRGFRKTLGGDAGPRERPLPPPPGLPRQTLGA